MSSERTTQTLIFSKELTAVANPQPLTVDDYSYKLESKMTKWVSRLHISRSTWNLKISISSIESKYEFRKTKRKSVFILLGVNSLYYRRTIANFLGKLLKSCRPFGHKKTGNRR